MFSQSTLSNIYEATPHTFQKIHHFQDVQGQGQGQGQGQIDTIDQNEDTAMKKIYIDELEEEEYL